MLNTSFILLLHIGITITYANISFIIAEITFRTILNICWRITFRLYGIPVNWVVCKLWKKKYRNVCIACWSYNVEYVQNESKPNEVWFFALSFFIHCQCISNSFPLRKLSMPFFSGDIVYPDISRLSCFHSSVSFSHVQSFLFNKYIKYSCSQTYRRIVSFPMNVVWAFLSIHPSWIFGSTLCKNPKKSKNKRRRKLLFSICAQSQEERKKQYLIAFRMHPMRYSTTIMSLKCIFRSRWCFPVNDDERGADDGEQGDG